MSYSLQIIESLKKTFLLLFLNIVFPLLLMAQVKFEASADLQQVPQSDYVKISFTVYNGTPTSIDPPNLKPFKVLGKEGGRSYDYNNGRLAYNYTQTYVLQTDKVGKHTIGAATAVVKGKKYRSKPITIEILPPGKKGTREKTIDRIKEGTAIMLKAEIDTSKVYLGQEVIVNFKLYTSVNLNYFEFISDPEYDGFYAQEIGKFKSSWKEAKINKVLYKVKTIKRVALFPQKSGLLEVPAHAIQAKINVRGLRRSFFETISSEVLKIDVNSLPTQNRPPSFSGAVGKYEMQLMGSNRSVISTQDAYTLRMSVFGKGDIKQIQAPDLRLDPDEFELYEPKSSQKSYLTEGALGGTKTFEYVFLAKKAGVYAISPAFSYFDTDSMKYVTLQPDTIQFEVTGDKVASTDRREDAIDKEKRLKNQDVLPIRTSTRLQAKGKGLFGTTIYWLLLTLPCLLFLGVIAYRQVQIKRGHIDISLLKTQKAGQVAQKRLSTAQTHLDEQNSRSFYEEVSQALWGYVGDKLGIPLSELNKENVADKLLVKNVSESHTQGFIGLLNTCDMALFAGMDNPADMNKVYQQATDIIVGIEEEIG